MQTLLFTGGTGYLGHNIKPILDKDYDVTTIGITERDMLKANLATEVPQLPKKYDVVLHAAGKAHRYPRTEAEKQAFFDVNYVGTVHLCYALEKVGVPESLIFISTMAVYGSDGSTCVTEDFPLNGDSPYAKSKIQAEEYLTKWCKKNGVKLGILRPSLLAGPNPPGNLGAMIKGIKSGRYLSIGHSEARKSFLMVYDIGNVISKLADVGGIYNICDNESVSYRELELLISQQLHKRPPISIPLWLAKLFAKIGDFLGDKAPINSIKLDKLTHTSIYSSAKIQSALNWQPLRVLDNFKIE